MATEEPNLDDFVKLFSLYPEEQFYHLEPHPQPDPYHFLFRQVMQLLATRSAFVISMPRPFLEASRHYNGGNAATVKHFNNAENRYFFLSDLKDWVLLQKKRRKRP
ncbi:conserved hypothetical protein [Magnetococcus marinus MC-1]|uniref:Uncharacterized protein n=1 Tax=Magnetococcus marinus (strain ATCC BAA-1437 / JCM 17883 / MC-1) TaxID=156889 RepID=A0L5F1_MAGMM|nr:hypothetical protein [Magnetococcus marinus]ABK43194.1 conserved hypothetical protein [Magnetococcus marinus MC-1]